MRVLTVVACLALGLLAACGEGGAPPARYDVFTVELVGLAGGERVVPGQVLTYRTHYVGDLARNLQWELTFTHEASGEGASVRWSDVPEDTAAIDVTRQIRLQHELLERSGRVSVRLRAYVTATRTGSTPWHADAPGLFSELYPSLDELAVSLPADPPLPYATPITFQVTGTDLWREVEVTVVDADTGAPVAGLERALPFDGSQPSLGGTWVLRAPGLERIGTHRLLLVARYGELELASEPIPFVVTHTIDAVAGLVWYGDGRLGAATTPPPRLGAVQALGLRIAGTQLAGHELRIDGGTTVIAAADEVDVVVLDPDADDFDDGRGQRTYELAVSSGGIERSASITLQRWGIDGCGWLGADGSPLPDGDWVPFGTGVVMEARVWGFPDTSGWWIFRSPLAEFALWEADPAGRPDPGDVSFLENNDDEVDEFDADVRSDRTAKPWTTTYDDEWDPLDLHLNAAEYYFEVKLEDQRCTSGLILVPPGG